MSLPSKTEDEPLFISACYCKPTDRTPVWIMRQAGRYLPEYRKIRSQVDFLTLTKTPDLAAEVTLQPVRRFEMDAAILFSDIMTPVEGMGVKMEFNPGPIVADPIRTASQIEALRIPDLGEKAPFVTEAIRIIRQELPGSVPLIGFAGAPFTLFCYLVEGQGSKTFSQAKSFLFAEPRLSRMILEKLTDVMIGYLQAQVDAGAQALMIFDSWAGLLADEDYKKFAYPTVCRIISTLSHLDIPLIYFPNQGATLLGTVKDCGADVVGVDWRTSLSVARKLLGSDIAVQGNLDPMALFSSKEDLGSKIDKTLREGGPEPGHIFNRGHGIDKNTDPDRVSFLVERVRETSQKELY
ncbi:MAG: uroporphyrinogen decarboxylase [Gemmatimonadetes bacterium]|nr:uroporphyrinogen decarboxylase [Gemmatimonadota bacterium]